MSGCGEKMKTVLLQYKTGEQETIDLSIPETRACISVKRRKYNENNQYKKNISTIDTIIGAHSVYRRTIIFMDDDC